MMLEDTLVHRLKQAQQSDHWIKAVCAVLGKDNYEDFYLNHGILYKDPIKELIVIPSSMEDEIIKMAHRQGHFSTNKTKDALEKAYYIPQAILLFIFLSLSMHFQNLSGFIRQKLQQQTQ